MGSLATAAGRGFPGVTVESSDEALQRRQIVEVVNNLLRGKMNVVSTLTLTANAATTTLTDSRIGPNSAILLMAQTANAAGALATTYFTAFADGSCTVNHANNAQVDKTFSYAVIG
jgi:hypothetical protein